MLEFFPNSDANAGDPQTRNPSYKRWILNTIGVCLMSLGRLREAVPFYDRANIIQLQQKDWHNASITYRNLAELHLALGDLSAGADAAREALALARKAENRFDETQSLSWQAWTFHLQGKLETASDIFKQAEKIEQERHTPNKQFLYSNRGVFHADHLRRTATATPRRYDANALSYARRITKVNLEICERAHWANQVSWCHRVLGDLDTLRLHSGQAAEGNPDSARAHYDEALRIARGISDRATLIEALLARGRFYAKTDLTGFENLSGLSDLEEALVYALQGGYRIYEADIRVALAWAYVAVGDKDRARQEAVRAREMSEQMGYYWGGVDAEEVLEKMGVGK